MADNEYDADPAVTAAATSPEHHPRRLLRILFGALLVAGMAAGYVAMGRQKAAKQAEAIDTVVRAGGRVYFDYQWQGGQPVPDAEPPQAAWLRRLVGDAMLNRAVAVDLRGVAQPDAVAQALLLLPDLRHIDAGDTPLSDAALAVWRQSPGLTGLDLQGTRITDAGIANLARLTQLARLSLARTAITDASSSVLSRLIRLERLDLDNTQMTAEALDRLRARLPRCQVMGK